MSPWIFEILAAYPGKERPGGSIAVKSTTTVPFLGGICGLSLTKTYDVIQQVHTV